MSANDPNANRPGYKETKVGWIPEEWEEAMLGDLTETGKPIVYGIVQAGPDTPGGIPYIRSTDVGTTMVPEAGLMRTTEEIAKKYRRAAVAPGDIVFSLRGNIGACSIVPTSLAGANLTQGTARISLSKKSSGQFVRYALDGYEVRRLVDTWAKGSTFREITIDDLRKVPIPFAPLPEQMKIAEILSTCDEAIEKTGALIEAKKRQKRALMQQLLTGRKRLPGFAGDWEGVKIGNLLKEVSRPVDWSDDELYRLVSVRRRSGGLFFREALHGRDILTKVMHTTIVNDFLISKMQVVHGAMAMTTEEFSGGHVSGSYITLIARDDARLFVPFFDFLSRTKWLYHLAFVSSYGVVIEKMTFNLRDFLKKEVRIPPTIDEQRAIVEVLKTIEREIECLASKQESLEKQKRSLMQKLLTGQVRVNV